MLELRQGGRGACFLAAFLFLAGCGTKTSAPDAGKLEDGVYKNLYFDIVLPVPQGWAAKTRPSATSQFLKYYLMALAAKKDAESEKRVFPMVRMASTPAGALRAADAAITVAAARISDKHGFDLAHAVKIARVFIKGSPTPVRITEDFHSEKVGEKTNGGVTFAAFEVEWTKKDEGVVFEALYIVLRRDYSLVISVEAKNPEALKRAQAALDSLRWRGAYF